MDTTADTVETQQALVTMTPAAAEKVRELLEAESDTSLGLRIFVAGGGCSGMQYGMVFDEPRDGDLASEQHGVGILVDPISAQYLRGTVVDFSDALTGGGFKITNPNARESCGCGKSFAA